MRTQTVVSAGGAIVDDGGRVVLTARRSFSGALQWGLPKGLVEPGEDVAQAATREATEETGLEVEALEPLPKIDYWYVDSERSARIHKFVHWFLMRPTGGDPTAHGTDGTPGSGPGTQRFKTNPCPGRAPVATPARIRRR